MKKYESKIEVVATEITAGEYSKKIGYEILNSDGVPRDKDEPGYRIKGPGFVKWMPKEDFEDEFRCVETWKDRLIIERDELLVKVTKLRDFINSKTFNHVSDKQEYLLREQLHHMQCYLDILDNRLAKWGNIWLRPIPNTKLNGHDWKRNRLFYNVSHGRIRQRAT